MRENEKTRESSEWVKGGRQKEVRRGEVKEREKERDKGMKGKGE